MAVPRTHPSSSRIAQCFAPFGWTLRRHQVTDTFCDASYRWVLDATDGPDSQPRSFGFRKLEHLWNTWTCWAPKMHHRWRVFCILDQSLSLGTVSVCAVRTWLASATLDLGRWAPESGDGWQGDMEAVRPHRFGADQVSDLDDDLRGVVFALLARVERGHLESGINPALPGTPVTAARRL
jgi:hypothetical protein